MTVVCLERVAFAVLSTNSSDVDPFLVMSTHGGLRISSMCLLTLVALVAVMSWMSTCQETG
jgi:hypothetical protein